MSVNMYIASAGNNVKCPPKLKIAKTGVKFGGCGRNLDTSIKNNKNNCMGCNFHMQVIICVKQGNVNCVS